MKLSAVVILALCVFAASALIDGLQDSSADLLEADNLLDESSLDLSRIKRYGGRRHYVMYHGTSVPFADSIIRTGFRPSSDGMLGPGVYVSRDIRKAEGFPGYIPANQRVILKVLVRVGKVKKIDTPGHPWQKTWHAHGYDTAWVPSNCALIPGGLEEDCVWDPWRIRILDIVKAPPQDMQRLKALLNQMKH